MEWPVGRFQKLKGSSMYSSPPPDGLLLRVLGSEQPLYEMLHFMKGELGAEKWAVIFEDGFWWMPHRLRHFVEVFDRNETSEPGEESLVCRSMITLVENVKDHESALAFAQYFNQRPFGASVWFDQEKDSIHATSWVALDPAHHSLVFLFVEAVKRKIGICEHIAPKLAALVDGEVPSAEHPEHGLRTEPDEFVENRFWPLYSPEGTLGNWWSKEEIASIHSYLMEEFEHRFDSVEVLEGGDYQSDRTSAANLEVSLCLTENGWLSAEKTDPEPSHVLSVGQADHPDFGRGIEVLISTPLDFGGNTDAATPPASSFQAQLVANSFNGFESLYCEGTIGISGWTTWRGQVHLSTFIPGETIATLHLIYTQGADPASSLADLCGGYVLGPLATGLMARIDVIAGIHEYSNFHDIKWLFTQDRRWKGVVENAGYHSLFVDDNEVFETVAAGLPLNELIDPICFEASEPHGGLFGLPHTFLIANFGIFNPAGPSAGSLELAIHYESGRALLLERNRHPFLPSITVHALLDQTGFASLGEYVEKVIARLEWTSLDWFEIVNDNHVDALLRGLRTFGQKVGEQMPLRQTATNLLSMLPWLRVSTPAGQEGENPEWVASLDDLDDLGFWVFALCHPANVDSHNRYFRSAWEGSSAFLHNPDDPTTVQEMVDSLIRGVHHRSATTE